MDQQRLSPEEKFHILKFATTEPRPTIVDVARRYQVSEVTVRKILFDAAANWRRYVTPGRPPGSH